VRSLRQLLSSIQSRPKAHLALAFVVVSNHFGAVALAAGPAVLEIASPAQAICGPDAGCATRAVGTARSTLSLPAGTAQCADSGPSAACDMDSPAVTAGTSSTPVGLSVCEAVDGKPVAATPASCAGELLSPDAQAASPVVGDRPIVAPSVPQVTLGSRLPDKITLSAGDQAVRAGKPVVLTAAANASVTGTDRAIEIFDITTGRLAGACAQGSQCSVAYTATSGVHEFGAFVTTPAATVPGSSVSLPSNHVSVGWLDSTITADRTAVGPGQPVTITVTSTFDVRPSGRWLEIYDLTAGARITYCSRGTVCTTTVRQPSDGVHQIVGYVTGKPEAVSTPINVTWLRVHLTASSIGSNTAGWVHLKATTNADLTDTGWVLGIYDQRGHLVDHVCRTGTTCSVQSWVEGSATPAYTAVVGALPAPPPRSTLIGKVVGAVTDSVAPSLVDVQARSGAVEPAHLLWGVDSCKAFTGDPTGELFSATVAKIGTPEFWGRYLTDTVCPGISSAEVALAARHHMGILPIYNEYNCSNVSYYDTGHAYAVEAADAARRIGIPRGIVLVIDIEPPGAACPGAVDVDGAFIEGWYDGVKAAGYVPGYYGNGTAGSEFASAWCASVSKRPAIAADSELWSFQPSLLGDFNKPTAPGYSPYDTGCTGNMEIWQYVLSAGSVPDVDQDEALSTAPLWYPS